MTLGEACPSKRGLFGALDEARGGRKKEVHRRRKGQMIWKIFLETLYPSVEQAFGRVSCLALSEAQEFPVRCQPV